MFDPKKMQTDLRNKALEQSKKLTRRDQIQSAKQKPDLNYAPSAGVFIRLLALLIDLIICGLLIWFFDNTLFLETQTKWILLLVLLPLVSFVGTCLFKASPGKAALGLKVIDLNQGVPLKPFKALMRETLGKALSCFLFLGFITIPFDTEKRGWHDKIFKTRVVVA